MTKPSFGQRLKRERELRGVSRDEICAATRIGTRFLEALEEEQWEVLPGGIFNRGFVRAVARFLGLDEDDLVAEYDLGIREQNSQVEVSVTLPVGRQSAKTRRFVLLGALSMFALLGTGWIWWRGQNKALRQAANEGNGVVVVVSHAKQTAPEPFAAETPGPASAAFAAHSSSLGAQNQGLELKIEAGKETMISILADGSKVFEGNMIAGQSRTFAAQDAIDISAKDAGALLLELNGQTLAPLGPPGQPGNLTLTRSDLKATGGGGD